MRTRSTVDVPRAARGSSGKRSMRASPRVRRFISICAFALSATTLPLRAEDLDTADAGDLVDLRAMSLEELMSLPVSTGSFLELDLRTSPVSLTLIDRAQIKASAARTLSELLEIYVPGFQYMVNKWNGDVWGMRGVAADRNTKFVFLINGLKQNMESRDGAYTELDLGLLGDLERIEVLRGPAGLVYGSGSIAGVINLVTRKPAVTSGEIAATYGSGNSISGEALAHAQGKAWALTVAGGYRRSSGLGDRETRIYGQPSFPLPLDATFAPAPLPNGVVADGSWGRTSGNYRLSADISYRDVLRWYTRYTHRATSAGPYFVVDAFPEFVGFPPADAPPRVVDGMLVGPNDPLARSESFGTNRREFLVDNVSSFLRYTPHVGPDQLTLEAAFVAAQDRSINGYRDGYGVEGASNPAGRIDTTMGERRYYASAQYLLKRFDKVESVTGVSLRVDDIGEDMEGLNFHGAVELRKEISNVVYTNVALYNETHLTPIEQLRLVAGLRLDKHTRTNYLLTARGAMVYMPSALHSIKLIGQSSSNNGSADNYEYNYAHYRTDGTVWDTTHLPEGPVNTMPTVAVPAVTTSELHALDPERVYSFELASTHTFFEALTLAPSVSYSHISNLFAWTESLQRVVNSGAYGVLALELDARGNMRRIHLSAGGSHVYQRPIKPDHTPDIYTRPAWEPYQLENGLWDVRETGGSVDTPVNTVRSQVTRDDRNFLNLATNVTKLYVDYAPWSFLQLHTDVRIFWGLRGRRDASDENEAAGFETLDVARRPIAKWNLGVRSELPQGFALGMHVYNLLGRSDGRHALRWQQMSYPSQTDLYAVDVRYFAGSLEKSF